MSKKTNLREVQEITNIPHDKEAEVRLLGNLIETPELVGEVVGKLKTDDLFMTSHRRIFDAIISLYEEKQPVDFLAINNKLAQREELASVGGTAYLASLIDVNNRLFKVENCITSIRKSAIKRKTLRSNQLISSLVCDPSAEWHEIVREVSRTTELVSEKVEQSPIPKLKDLLLRRLEHVEELSKHPGQLIGIPSGFPALDRITCGFQPGNLIVVAARPSKGKTSLGLNFAEHACSLGKSVAFFSLEMTDEDLADRFICSVARVDLHLYRTGYLNRENWRQLGHAIEQTGEYKLTIDQTAKQTPLSIRAQCQRVKKELGLDMILVDYLQLVNADVPKDKRYQEIGAISHELKAIGKEFGVPVVVLAQLNREVEKRADHKPQLSDLREAGDIEQEADLVILLHTPPADPNTEDLYPTVNILVEKHRNGPTGKIELVFCKEFTRFESASRF